MDLNEVLAGRRAVREYTAAPVDEAALRALVQAAVLAPSAMNQQPWAFAVVRDAQRLDRLSGTAKAHMLSTMPDGPHTAHLRPLLDDPKFHIFYHAPALVLICAEQAGPWIVEDCSLAAENLMLAAHGLGLGSCWIGFAQGYLNTPEGKRLLDLPESWVPVAPIIIGHPAGHTPPVERKPAHILWV
jgi:nitroreductase